MKDLCTRKIVGYAFSERIDIQLTLAALDMAYRRRKPQKGLIFHSDRGVQYASRAYRERLEAYGIRQSMSRRGDPYDNAVAESFFSWSVVQTRPGRSATPATMRTCGCSRGSVKPTISHWF